jgi:hypothetical protein
MNDALLFNQAATIGGSTFGAYANIAEGAQNGLGPHILKMDAASPLIFNNAIIVMLSGPGMWNQYPEALQALKAIWERHARSWSGIDFGYTLDFHDQNNSNDGQQLSMPTSSKRTPVNPQMTSPELAGNLVWNLHYKWICDIQNPDTQASQLSSQFGDDEVPQWILSTISASILIIQPDPTMIPDRIIDAAVITNMMPTETGNIGWKKDIGSSGESPERQITYKGLIQHNQNTRELGRLVMRAQQMHKPDWTRATTFAGVDSSLSQLGLEKEVQDALRDFQIMT